MEKKYKASQLNFRLSGTAADCAVSLRKELEDILFKIDLLNLDSEAEETKATLTKRKEFYRQLCVQLIELGREYDFEQRTEIVTASGFIRPEFEDKSSDDNEADGVSENKTDEG